MATIVETDLRLVSFTLEAPDTEEPTIIVSAVTTDATGTNVRNYGARIPTADLTPGQLGQLRAVRRLAENVVRSLAGFLPV